MPLGHEVEGGTGRDEIVGAMKDKPEGIAADTKKVTGITVNGKSLMDILQDIRKKTETKKTLEVRKTTSA